MKIFYNNTDIIKEFKEGFKIGSGYTSILALILSFPLVMFEGITILNCILFSLAMITFTGLCCGAANVIMNL